MISRRKVLMLLLCVSICVVLREHVTEIFSQHLDSSPCACGTCLADHDVWFMQHFNKSVEPFLSQKYTLPEAVFNWWKALQAEKHNFAVYSATVDKLFQTFPPVPDVVEGSPERCRTCAVVGNSANLKRSHYGPLIDYHDIVIRMNRGHTRGYEADVGSRTTHHVMYPESAVNLDNHTHLVLVPFKILDLEWLIKAFTTGFTGASYMPVKSKIKANKDLVMVVNPAFMKFVHDRWLKNKGKYPSTGFMALVLALHICDKVSVFGFGTDKDGNWSHYWEKLQNLQLKTGVHPGTHEYEILQQLAEHHKVEFFTGW